MNRPDSSKMFSRRAFVVGALQTSALCMLGGRLAWLQLVKGQRYRVLSDNNRINVKITAPSRGVIVDRAGVQLAVNNQNFRVLVVPEQTKDLEESVRSLTRYMALDEDEIEDVLKRAKRSPKFAPVEIKDNLSWQDVAKIEVNVADLPGLQIDTGELRSYPFGPAAVHLVGYVGAVSKQELEEAPVLGLPGFKIGKTGIEKQYDTQMRGLAGTSKVEVNVVGREVRELDKNPSTPGRRIMLSIDSGLQQFMHQRLSQERSASAVIMDVHSGEVYALSSYPSFDPNDLTRGISARLWEELLAMPGYPLTNKAVAGQYPPASTFKMVTVLAGLQAGKSTSGRRSYCSGVYEYGNDRFHCWKGAGHGYVDAVDALAESCDVYFYELATEIGIEKIAETARQLGLGQTLGFDLPQERSGLIPDKDWKMGHFGEFWKKGETIVSSIGQGYLLATPLQLAVMTSRLVNGGYAVEPRVTAAIGDHVLVREQWPKMDVEPAHLALIQKGMERVVNHREGTAYQSRIEDPAMAFGGKTGTAQVARITKAQRAQGIKNETLPWKQRHHALFCGYAPLNNPRYACSVVVEHGVGGSSTAAPLARDLLLETQKRGLHRLALAKGVKEG